MNSPRGRDDGTVLLLTLGFAVLALMLTAVVIDASVVFLARRSLLATCDSAALFGAQRLDVNRAYRGGAGANALPLDSSAETGVSVAVAEWQRQAYSGTERPDLVLTATTDGRSVTVRGRERVGLPFGAVLRILGIGPVTVTGRSQAQAQSIP